MDKFPIHHPQSSKISNRKALLCSKIYIERQSRSKIYTFSPSLYQRKQRNFLKYFPKYIDKLEVPVKQGSVKNKIKRIRTLRSPQHLIFSGNIPQALYENLKRVLLYNKEKYVRNYTVYDYTNLSVKNIQAYKNLQSLVFTSLRESIFNPVLQLCYLRKACRFVQTQFNLRHLHFNIASEEEILCISKINSCKRVLESLESFIFTIRCLTEGEDVKILQHLLLYKNILKATTHLNIVCSEYQTSTEISHQLLTHCPKLRGFYFQDYRSNRESPSLLVATPFPSCLPALKNMENLSLLKVIVNKTWPFLRDFTFLPSIQDVQLEFLPFKKSIFAGKESLPPIFTDFCEKFNNANLKNLKVLFNQTIENCDLLIPFLQQWLKKISSLQTLTIQLTPQKDSKVIKLPFMKKLDFSLFLDSIKHLGSSLESLSITDGQLFYKMEIPSEEMLAFPSLQKLILNAFLPQGPQINKLFESHLLNSITLESEKPLDITLRELKFDSMDTFMSFVGLFDKANFVKRTLTIDVHAEIKVLPRAVDFSYSQTYVREFRLYSKNVSIKLKVQTKERFLDDDESRSEFTKLLQVLKFEEKPVPLFNYYRVIYL